MIKKQKDCKREKTPKTKYRTETGIENDDACTTHSYGQVVSTKVTFEQTRILTDNTPFMRRNERNSPTSPG